MNKLSHTTNAAIGEQPTKHTNDTHRTCDSLLRQTSVNDPTKNCKPQHRQQQSTHTNREPPQNESDQKMHGETPTLLLFTEGKLVSSFSTRHTCQPRSFFHDTSDGFETTNTKENKSARKSRHSLFGAIVRRHSIARLAPLLLLSTIDTLIVAPFLHSDPTNGSSSEVIR